MNEFIFFVLGCLFGRYVLCILDYILEWFASYTSLRISLINTQINELSQEQQAGSSERIGFVVQDCDLGYESNEDDMEDRNKIFHT